MKGYEKHHLVRCHSCSFVFASKKPSGEDESLRKFTDRNLFGKVVKFGVNKALEFAAGGDTLKGEFVKI